jgi:queuine tRNA-ribosyltransferase
MIGENPRYGRVTDRGIHFTDIDGGGRKVLFTPERSIRQQFDLGSDLVVCLDDCPRAGATPEEVAASVRRTVHWAERCREEFDRQIKTRRLEGDDRPLLFGVVQGGYDPALREECARGLLPLGFDGYGFGGWPLDPEGNLADGILAHTAGLVPEELPRFALGVGKPEHIARCYGLGWRIFDCVLPTRDARHGRLYVYDAGGPGAIDAGPFYHHVYVRDEKHKRQAGPVSEACDCPCCRHYSLAYLHHLFDVGDPLGLRLATLHNLRFYTRLLESLATVVA